MKRNFYFRLWLAFTVWMLRHNKFDYSSLSRAEILERLYTWKQGWPWVEANLQYMLEELKK